jgi:adenylate cyclase class 2
MAHEIETKVLDIDKKLIEKKLKDLNATGGEKVKLTVDWYRKVGVKEGEDPWFLRIRSYNDMKHEVTWKAKSEILGTARKHKEINFIIPEPEKLADLFEELDLENYAHQEKYRATYNLNDWQFDIDEYPNMPAFIEIEGQSEEHVKEAVKMLDLETHKTWAKGERILIQEIYNLDWYKMNFK